MGAKKRTAWFRQTRWSYIPCSWQGALTYLPFIAYLVVSVVVTYQRNSSIPTIVIEVFAEWVAAGVVMQWLASHKS